MILKKYNSYLANLLTTFTQKVLLYLSPSSHNLVANLQSKLESVLFHCVIIISVILLQRLNELINLISDGQIYNQDFVNRSFIVSLTDLLQNRCKFEIYIDRV